MYHHRCTNACVVVRAELSAPPHRRPTPPVRQPHWSRNPGALLGARVLTDAGRTAGPRRNAALHDARHTAATLLLAQGLPGAPNAGATKQFVPVPLSLLGSMGVPIGVVKTILGHSQITLTLGTYSHVVPELAHDAAQRMANVLWPATADENPDTLVHVALRTRLTAA
jgi:hypothetical protein